MILLGQRSGTYGSRPRCGSSEECIWLSGSQTNLSRHFFKTLQSSEYIPERFSKVTLVSSSGFIQLDRSLAMSVSNQTILRSHVTPLSRNRTGLESFLKVVESENVIFQDLESFGKERIFKMALEKF